jgi:2-dehydro-3-deoxyphosphogalactonate aldolase
MTFDNFFSEIPLVAILNGLKQEKAIETGRVLIKSGFKVIAVAMNSKNTIQSIALMVKEYGKKASIGAGSVLATKQVSEVADVGGQFIVSPNCNVEVIRQTKQLGLKSLPGIATPTEAFNALDYGADILTVFPAELILPVGIKAMLAVLPKGTQLLPIGGIDLNTMVPYIKAGASGFGFGGLLFRPYYLLTQIEENALRIIQAYQKRCS